MNSRAKKFLLLATAAALLTVNGFLLPVLNRERAAIGITRLEPLENAPPMLALTTQVLGGFRGLIANALWMRMTQLQDDGKYFEMVQLADWITKLEPHIINVWQVQSWNMAFNVSVKFPDHADRWRWVQRGMELLRDDALRYNPGQPLLYADLSWLFQFKMGANLDDANPYYKGMWAAEMSDLFGGARPNFDRLISPQTPGEQQRARLLRSKYKMDAAKMRDVNQRYGPLDWRLPEAHAIYWAVLGMENSPGEDVRRLRQGILQSMNFSFQRGRLVLTSNAPPRLLPNLEIVPKVDAAFREQLAAADPILTNNMARAYRNFLREVPYHFFIFNRAREGEQWLRQLRQQFPGDLPADVTLAEYAVARAMENSQERSQPKITTLVYAFVQSAYFAVIEDNPDAANEYMLRASDTWNAYTKRTGGDPRVGLLPLKQIKETVIKDLLAPDSGLSLEGKARLRTAIPGAAELVPDRPPAPK